MSSIPKKEEHADHLFAEQFNKVAFRDFQNNTRLNIKNANYQEAKIKRERQINYWKNNVIHNFLPPITEKNKERQSQPKRKIYINSRDPQDQLRKVVEQLGVESTADVMFIDDSSYAGTRTPQYVSISVAADLDGMQQEPAKTKTKKINVIRLDQLSPNTKP